MPSLFPSRVFATILLVMLVSCGTESGPRASASQNPNAVLDSLEPAPEQAPESTPEPAPETTPQPTPGLDYKNFGLLRLGDRLIDATSQAATDRTFQETATELIQTIGQLAGDPVDSAQVLVSVTILRLHPDGSRVYAFDQARKQIRSFRIADGKFDRAYGAPGRGDGEFGAVVDFDVASDGSVWVLDTALRRVVAFESDASVRRSNSFDVTAHSFALLPGNGTEQRYVILSGINTPEVFHVFDATGVAISSFGTFAEKSIMNLGMLGALARTSRGYALVPWYAGRIVAFDSDIKLDFYRSTLYPTALQRLGASGSGQILEELEGPVRSRAPIVTRVTDDVFFVAAYQREPTPTPVDAYDLRTGDYKYSIDNPDRTGACVVWGVTDKSIFTICPVDGTIQQWKRIR